MQLPDDELDIPPQVNIVPMIDVIFAILTFLIVSSLFLTRSQGLPVNLPTASTSQTQRQSEIVITLNQQGQLALNRQPITLDALEQQVRNQLRNQPQALVVINADEEVTHGRVVAVMDQLRRIEGVKLAIATTKVLE